MTVLSLPSPPFTYRSLQLLGGCIDAYVAVRVLASEPGLDDIKVDGIVELVGSLPAYRNRVLRMTRQIHNRRCTGSAHIGALGNLIGGFALVLCCECLDNDAVVGKGFCGKCGGGLKTIRLRWVSLFVFHFINIKKICSVGVFNY